MERTDELDSMLQERLSRLAAVVYQNSPAVGASDASIGEFGPISGSQTDQTSSPPAHVKARQFWEKQVSDVEYVPIPTCTYGSTGLGRSFFIPARDTHVAVAYPMTSSVSLPYYGKHIHHTRFANWVSRKTVSEKKTKSDLAAVSSDKDSTDTTESKECNQLSEFEVPSCILSTASRKTSSHALVALLETSNVCLSLLSGTYRPFNDSNHDVQMANLKSNMFGAEMQIKPIHLPRRALMNLIAQFTSIRTKGIVNFSEIMDSFKSCRRVVEKQWGMECKPGILLCDKDMDREPIMEEECGDELMITLRREFDALKARYNIEMGERPALEDGSLIDDDTSEPSALRLPFQSLRMCKVLSLPAAQLQNIESSIQVVDLTDVPDDLGDLSNEKDDFLDLAFFKTEYTEDNVAAPDSERTSEAGGEDNAASDEAEQKFTLSMMDAAADMKMFEGEATPTATTLPGGSDVDDDELAFTGLESVLPAVRIPPSASKSGKKKRNFLRFSPACFRSSMID